MVSSKSLSITSTEILLPKSFSFRQVLSSFYKEKETIKAPPLYKEGLAITTLHLSDLEAKKSIAKLVSQLEQ